jgi:hypothetical protein
LYIQKKKKMFHPTFGAPPHNGFGGGGGGFGGGGGGGFGGGGGGGFGFGGGGGGFGQQQQQALPDTDQSFTGGGGFGMATSTRKVIAGYGSDVGVNPQTLPKDSISNIAMCSGGSLGREHEVLSATSWDGQVKLWQV